jgi:hypothetical protein
MRPCFAAIVFLSCAAALTAQEIRPKDIRELGKGGSSAIPKLQEHLKNPSVDVRVELISTCPATCRPASRRR